ncbi:4912_t:CDS:2 [Acaulospora colombiana]|uniref:4912_t:CDS:1 n=1 Tax=Acaulospora colombiana TaxID=27376 RepID=A0ACA9L8U1_9GLOM|nr:4912_t:CDS:2 [Acaulospora colombiana]
MSDSDPEDYMSSKYLVEAPSTSEHQTYTERRRKKLQSNSGYIKPRHVLDKESLEQGLSKRIDNEESPGMKILMKMGYEKGKPLGKEANGSGLTEPLSVELKQGVGMSTQIKKRAQNELAKAAKRAKIEEETFIERMSRERMIKRLEEQLHKIQKMCETLDNRKGIQYNVFWPNVEDEERIEETPGNYNSTLNEESLSKEKIEEFKKLPSKEKFCLVQTYLRDQHHYCFWCGCEYGSAEELLEECPGIEEEDHD